MARRLGIAGITVIVAAVVLGAQEREDRTLLTQDADDRDHQRGLGRARDAPRARARAVPARAAARGIQGPLPRERGHGAASPRSTASATSRSRASPTGQAWQPTQGELWMTTPKSVKLYDIHDIALSLASLNANGDVTRRARGRRRRAARRTSRARTSRASSCSSSSGVGGGVRARRSQRGAIGVLGVSAIGSQRHGRLSRTRSSRRR